MAVPYGTHLPKMTEPCLFYLLSQRTFHDNQPGAQMTEPSAPGVVHQVYGPPGTGKTTYLASRVQDIAKKRGPDSVAIASFTVTAAQEIASRGLGLNKRMVGTLHSHAFRSLGAKLSVALDPKIVSEWNSHVGPEYRLTADSRRGEPGGATEGGRGAFGGDELLSEIDQIRSGFGDPASERPEVAEFWRRWSEFKTANDAVDFTDMIHLAWERARDGEPCPGRPEVFILDEAQDSTPLETELALAWGRQASSMVAALDDDQSIMTWRGGSPERMLDLPGDPDYTVDRLVLDKSWRIPVSVHAVAERWVRRLSRRQEKVYRPRTVHTADGTDTGELVRGAAFGVPYSLRDHELTQAIEDAAGRGETVMVIASCSYMLDPLIADLKRVGIPFCNPYRPSEGRWNPLGGGNGMSTAERVRRYLLPDPASGPDHRMWTYSDLRAWLELVAVREGGLRRGAKSLIRDGDDEVPWEEFAALFADEHSLERAAGPDLEWLASAIMGSKRKIADYPLEIARQRGPGALAGRPLVTLGTIHSVKGGASDIVYLAPDLSQAGASQVKTRNGRDQLIRLMYVGMTRSREELRLLAPFTNANYLARRDLIPTDLEVLP